MAAVSSHSPVAALEARAVALSLALAGSAGASAVDRRSAVDDLQRAASADGLAGPALQGFHQRLQQLFPDVFVDATRYSGPEKGAVAARFGGVGDAVGKQFSTGTSDAGAIVGARLGTLLSSTAPPAPLAVLFPPRGSAKAAAARQAMMTDLAGVPVRGADGASSTLLDKLQRHPGLSPTQHRRILDVVATIKAGYDNAEAAMPKPPGYQQVNWKHTRLELDRVLDVAIAHGLSPKDTESAILASAFSDSVKAPSNFIAHNVHGAQAALYVLSRSVPALSADQLEDVTRAILEHQVGPPGFMGQVAMRGILKAKGADAAVVDSIASKIARPFDHQHDGAVVFSADEHRALATVGVPAWTVPGTGRHQAIARAVIDADSLVNYACPDGWAKLAALHGPDQPVFLQEPLLRHALTSLAPGHASARKSFDDARAVVSDAARPLYDQGLARTEAAVARVELALQRWVVALPATEVPVGAGGGVPYLSAPLNYSDAVEVDFARRLRDEAVRLLRAEEQT
jgi:hypothetical protein